MQKLKDRVLKYITDYATRERPADRFQMAKFFGTSEREIRYAIEELRNEGKRICSSSSSGGYWLATTEQDYERFRAEYVSRATKTLRTARAMDRATDGQTEMIIL